MVVWPLVHGLNVQALYEPVLVAMVYLDSKGLLVGAEINQLDLIMHSLKYGPRRLTEHKQYLWNMTYDLIVFHIASANIDPIHNVALCQSVKIKRIDWIIG